MEAFMKTVYLLALLCVSPLVAHAELYKSVDADGHVTYSSTPLKGGKKIFLEPLPTMAPLAKARVPTDFPKVDGETQKGRDGARRKILQDELNTEQKLLEEAKQNLQSSEGENRGSFLKNGKVVVNESRAQEYAADVTKQNNEVSIHQKNIDALNSEISKLK
jgi:hypothetical protein